ncbi:DUF3592 domain-containing protein [Streptomyces sp. NPDC050560]|uniref:DUF3592 domain-containing protein n=1 Tax=Streptomyces sp. NPDC050560 TaxID=3365630 RepID=UPI003790FF19
MDAMSQLLPILFMCLAVSMLVRRVVKLSRQLRIWRHGAHAEGRCVRTWVSIRSGRNGGSSTMHHVYEFRTLAGDVMRFEETEGPATVVEGDFATVTYLPERPERATAKPHREGREYAHAAAEILFLIVFFTFALFFLLSVP